MTDTQNFKINELLQETAIVILNYNGLSFLEQFLPSLIQYTSPLAAIWVADNGSKDDSMEFVETNFPTIYRLYNKANYGFAEGYNRALAHIPATYYILLNSDVEVASGWLEPLLERLAMPKVAAVQPKIRAFFQRDTFEHAGGSGGYIDGLGYPFCRGRMFSLTETDTGQYDDAVQCFWATGACMAVKAQVFHDLGGLDGEYFAHMEEIDWCWRAKRAGYEIWAEPRAVVYHVGGGTLPVHNPRKNYLNFRNSLATLLKNEPFERLVWLLPMRLVLDGVAGVVFLSEGKFKDIIMIIRAHWRFFFQFRNTLRKRELYDAKIEKCRIDTPNMIGHVPISIVQQFYLKGKKKFSDLYSYRNVQ